MPEGGDPHGRRPASRRAIRLAEAGLVAYALKALLRRADYGTAQIKTLQESIQAAELKQLQIAHGRIEPRRRFKAHSSQPLLDERSVHNLYLDESGIAPPEPLIVPSFFALGAVGMTDEFAEAYKAAADDIKMEFFGRANFSFHEPDMRYYDGKYDFGGSQQRRAEFDQAIDELVANTSFVVFGVGVRKTAFESEFVETGIDPYLPTDAYSVAIAMLLERYVDYLAMECPENMLGRLTFESIGSREDAERQLAYATLLLEGTQWISDKAFRNWLETGLRFVPKRGSHPYELADMFARELYEWIRGECDVTPKRWNLFSRKVYIRGNGQMGKFGVKVFPDLDIRERIEEHRRLYGAKPEN